jgi:hypothetical protein
MHGKRPIALGRLRGPNMGALCRRDYRHPRVENIARQNQFMNLAQ